MSKPVMKAIIVPVKEPSNAKTRLDTLLSPAERGSLAWAMFLDVTRALKEIKGCCTVFVVTSYERAASHAQANGFGVLPEDRQLSESASVDWASETLAGRGFDSVLRLPADLPLIQGSDVAELVSVEVAPPASVLVPSRDGTGTNAIMRCPPGLFPSHFGPNSLALHIEESNRAGAAPLIISNDRIGLDIDEPADIQAFLERGSGTETFRIVSEIDVTRRMKELSRKMTL
ncbi:MAG TPA: 2-phospho-L-lactate guanylyltransferase [Blastocatellia bacterium]